MVLTVQIFFTIALTVTSTLMVHLHCGEAKSWLNWGMSAPQGIAAVKWFWCDLFLSLMRKTDQTDFHETW